MSVDLTDKSGCNYFIPVTTTSPGFKQTGSIVSHLLLTRFWLFWVLKPFTLAALHHYCLCGCLGSEQDAPYADVVRVYAKGLL